METSRRTPGIGGWAPAPLVPSSRSFPQPHTTHKALSQLSVKGVNTQHEGVNRRECREPSDGEHREENTVQNLLSQLIGTEVSKSASEFGCEASCPRILYTW